MDKLLGKCGKSMLKFYENKNVFITGHTGFKGSWLCQILVNLGANVTGYSLEPPTEPSLFKESGIESKMKSIIGDIRDIVKLAKAFEEAKPEIVFHLAAQPLVRDSYEDPRYTYETNVMGTVNILECVRKSNTVKSVLNITTDKVYKNNEWVWGYRETDYLDGYDPYSNSKSCSELVTHSYKNAFFNNNYISVSTARAGNVLGGGDFAKDRIIPDCIRAAVLNQNIIVRNPYSVRPYQHVLDPLFAYLLIVKRQYDHLLYADYYNIGPDEVDCVSTGDIVGVFCDKWEKNTGKELVWVNQHDGGPHEANLLKLDCSKIKSVFNWRPTWSVDKTIEKTVEWVMVYQENGDISTLMDRQISEFIRDSIVDF